MSGRDGTGPTGAGTMTGRGMGSCAGGVPGDGAGRGLGLGLGRRHGFGCERGIGRKPGPMSLTGDVSRKELLARQKQALESRLEVVNKQLEAL